MFELADEVTPWVVDIYGEIHGLNVYLKEKGIGTRHQYRSIPDSDLYSSEKDFPVAYQYSRSGLWLPSFVDITNDEIDYICEHIKGYYAEINSRSNIGGR
jgi:dTDP-4-amino-4,6-dideoxygalactose transaminase